jgi:hypothetical protein
VEILGSQGAPSVSTTRAANLPPLSTTPAANFVTSSPCVVDTGGKFASGVNDTGDKFAAVVNDAGGKLPPVSTTQRWPNKIITIFLVEDFFHLPPVWLTPVANLELRISLRIFEKLETILMEYSGAGGKLIHEKNQKQKISWHCPFKPKRVTNIWPS